LSRLIIDISRLPDNPQPIGSESPDISGRDYVN